MTYDHVLRELAEAEGAILYWQVSDEGAFQQALRDNKISYDEETDCYLHLSAFPVDGGGFAMPKPDIAPLIALYADFRRCIGREGLGSADEHTSDATLTSGQREWLRAFVALWDACV